MDVKRWLGLLLRAVRKDSWVLLTRPIAAILSLGLVLVILTALLSGESYEWAHVGGVIVLAGCCIFIGAHLDSNIDKEIKWLLLIVILVSLGAIADGFWDWIWWDPHIPDWD